MDDAAQAGARLRTIIAALNRYQLGNLGRTKGLGFCVSIRHARFMAEQFTLAGIKAVAITSETADDVRKRAVRASCKLRTHS